MRAAREIAGEIDTYGRADWDDVLDVNLRGVVYGIQAVYPHMRKQHSGHIVNTASLAGLLPEPGMGSYTASKHAVVGLSKGLRIEAIRHGVKVSVVCPGVIRTPILSGGLCGRMNVLGVDASQIEGWWERLRPMEPNEFARQSLKRVFKNEAIIVVPDWWKVLWYLERLSSALSMALAGKTLDRRRRLAAEAKPEPAQPDDADRRVKT